MTRPLYRHADLRRLLSPARVALIGASPRTGSFAQRTMEQLAGFPGALYLVNPRYERIGEHAVFPSVAALPEVPDCAVIALPRDAVADAVLECARAGVGGVVVYASGYAETGIDERKALQEELAAIGRAHGMRVLGPNCMGFANYAAEMVLSFVAYTRSGKVRRSAIGVASQSGAISNSLIEAGHLGVSFSHSLSAGNSCDVDVADLIAFLAEEPSCAAIACVIEGLTDPLRFIEAAQLAWSKGKPLIVYKMATGSEGVRAASSHTGMLAGSNQAYAAAFERCGVIVVPRLEDVIETAAFFAKAPAAPLAPGVAVISTSGGAAIMSADAAEQHGVAMPQPGPPAQSVLDQHIPEYGSSRNPFDVTAQLMADMGALRECAKAVTADPMYGAVVMAQPQAYEAAVPRIAMIGELTQAAGKMACNVLVSQWLSGPGALETQLDERVALFRSMDRCFATLHAWHERSLRLKASHGGRTVERTSPPQAVAAARDLLRVSDGPIVTEALGKRLLAAYGVPVVSEVITADVEAAAAAAGRLGYPVVLKVDSPDIPHKTEAGVVRLNVRDEAELRQAHAELLVRASQAASGVRINGVLVQPMVGKGLELMVGSRVDPQFGPLVVVGFGGILVELLRDAVTALAPVNHQEALAMLSRLKAAALLDGFRGADPVDRDEVARVICRVSEMAADLADTVEEIDVNPLICSATRVIAVDALFVLRQGPASL